MTLLSAGLRRWLGLSLSGCIVACASSAIAGAVYPETLCVGLGSPGGAVNTAAEDALRKTASSAESMISVSGKGAPTVRRPDLEVQMTGDGQPTAETRAAYCSAAGELARRGRYGTPIDAPGYLLDAFLSAEQAKSSKTAAVAAYRLGLALVVNPVGASGRGAVTRGAGDAVAGIGAVFADQRSETDSCAQLDGLTDARAAFETPATLALRCAALRARDAGDADLCALARLRLARLLLDWTLKTPENAEALRDLARQVVLSGLGETGMRPGAALTARLIETGLDAGLDGDPSLDGALAEMETSGAGDAAVLAQASALRGRMSLAHGDGQGAERLFQRALVFETQRAVPTRAPDWYMLLAQADPVNRKAHVRAAYLALERVRPRLPLQDPMTEESTYDLHMKAVFEAAVADALETLPAESAGRMVALSRAEQGQLKSAQSIIEAFRAAELQNAFGDECIRTSLPPRPEALRSDEVILYPLILPDRVEILVLRGGRGATYQRLTPNVAYNQERVAALVRKMRMSIIHETEAWRGPSAELYALLVKPVEPILSDHTTLVIIPDSTLSALPFSALSDEKGRFLVEKARLDIAPGLAYAQPGSVRSGKTAFVLAGSLDRDMKLAFGTFGRLRNAGLEVRYATGAGIGERGPHGLYLRNFDRASLTEALQHNDVDVLHLATHASFSGGTDRTFIVANGDFISLSDLSDMLSASRAHGRQLDLLILSACETAVGDDKANLGLAGAAVQSGARGAIASLWEVDDKSTSQLMQGFYANYRSGKGKAEAMQASQLAMLRNSAFAAPRYWASLILVGGWR